MGPGSPCEIIFVDFISDFVDQKAHVVRKNGRASCSLLDAADHLFLLSHPTTSLPPRCCSSIKSQRVLSARSTGFLYVSLLSFFSSLLALSKSRRQLRSSPGRLSHLRSSSQVLSPRSPPMDPHYSLQVPNPEVPPEAHRVLSLSSPHHQPLNLNRRENGRPTPCNLRSSNRTRFRMITFQRIATSTLTPQQWPTLPPTPVAPFPSLVRTCCFRPWERVSLVRSNSVSICNGGKKSP
jgi:hypothetical protein